MRQLLWVPLWIITLPLFSQGNKAGDTTHVTIPGTEVSFAMAYIPAGSITMDIDGEKQEVRLDSFWISVHEVAHDEFTLFRNREYDNDESTWEEGEFMADAVTRPSPPYTDITFGMGSTGGFPAVSMTQQAALFYCYWLYTKTGEFYRLPTEAEWTYACLAGSEGAYPEDISEETFDEHVWYYDNSEEKYHRVGLKEANPWGLHDMLGNIAEWTLDNYSEEYVQTVAAQEGDAWIKPEKRYGRTVKGGSFDDFKEDCTCRTRIKSTAQWQKRDPQIPKSLWWNTDSPHVGFRLVKPANPMSPEEVEAFFEQAIKW